jgi:hypothetical protein
MKIESMIDLQSLADDNPELAKKIRAYCRGNGIDMKDGHLLNEKFLNDMKNTLDSVE